MIITTLGGTQFEVKIRPIDPVFPGYPILLTKVRGHQLPGVQKLDGLYVKSSVAGDKIVIAVGEKIQLFRKDGGVAFTSAYPIIPV